MLYPLSYIPKFHQKHVLYPLSYNPFVFVVRTQGPCKSRAPFRRRPHE